MKAYHVVKYDYDSTITGGYYLDKNTADKKRAKMAKENKKQHNEMNKFGKEQWLKFFGNTEEYGDLPYEDLWEVEEIEIE